MTGCLIILLAVIGSVCIGSSFGEPAGWAAFSLSMLIIAIIAMAENGKGE